MQIFNANHWGDIKEITLIHSPCYIIGQIQIFNQTHNLILPKIHSTVLLIWFTKMPTMYPVYCHIVQSYMMSMISDKHRDAHLLYS